MFIQPDTEIRLLKNCPLDNTYEHTIYFDSLVAQEEYFKSFTSVPFTKQTYQRYSVNALTIQSKMEDVYNCNYLMFRNHSFEKKWFYAFITKIEYVNNITCRVYYEIDVMQTWMRDYELQPCFVEREHSEKDVIGGNLVPESLETGEYISSSFETPDGSGGFGGGNLLGNHKIVVACTFDKSYTDVGGTEYGGIYSGLAYNVFDNSGDAANFILNAGAKTDGIVAVFMMPNAFITGGAESPKTYENSKPKNFEPYNFTVKNNKLLTYPYNFLYVTNMQGGSAVYPYEYFEGNSYQFMFAGDMSCNPSVLCVPRGYKGVTLNYDEKLTLSGFPQCSYATDSFKAWLAQNAGNLAIGAINGGAGMMTAQDRYVINPFNPYVAASARGVAIGAAVGVASSMINIAQHSFMPDQAHTATGSTTLAALRVLTFAFMEKHITNEFAKRIDSYFSMFGYATKSVKVPNRSSRPCWNYTKTIGCVVTGSVPADDMRKICDIYNAGITFWKPDAVLGDYSQDNSPNGG